MSLNMAAFDLVTEWLFERCDYLRRVAGDARHRRRFVPRSYLPTAGIPGPNGSGWKAIEYKRNPETRAHGHLDVG